MPRELKLLDYMVRRPGRIITRSMLLQDVWGYSFEPNTNVVDVHMGRLRRKVDGEGEAQLIRNVRGRVMSSIFPTDPRARATWRWGSALAAMLVLQSLALAAVFWVLAHDNHRREIEHQLSDDCTFFRLTPAEERPEELREKLDRDLHRDLFLALFDADGRRIAGNVAHLPPGAPTGGSFVATVVPTELPGKQSDEARVQLCAMPDGTRLLIGVDLDDTVASMRLVGQSLLVGLVPGILMALVFGLIAGRRAARQVDAVRRLTERIMAGDLSGRLPVPGDPDSFGLLCADINLMLDRLQLLVGDMRGIGDDIAHQLRTPLTRLRARVERGCATIASATPLPRPPRRRWPMSTSCWASSRRCCASASWRIMPAAAASRLSIWPGWSRMRAICTTRPRRIAASPCPMPPSRCRRSMAMPAC